MSVKITQLGKYGKPLCSISDNKLLVYNKGWLDIITDDSISEHLCKLPLSFIQKCFSKIRICERILRTEPRIAVYDSNHHCIYLSHNGFLLTIDINKKSIITKYAFRNGMLNPLNITMISGVSGFSDSIVFGDYWGNPNFDDVSIYAKKRDSDTFSPVFTFPKELLITHVHNIVPDMKNNCVYILTGDTDAGSGIWVAKNDFMNVEPLFVGSQQYRACVASLTDEGIIIATDTPLEQNALYLIKKAENGISIHPEHVENLPASVIYGVNCGESLIFSTTVEPNPEYHGIRYLLTKNRGKGISDNFVRIYMWNGMNGLTELKKFKKDFYPGGLCQFGAVTFVSAGDAVYAYPVSVKEDGMLYKIEVN